MLYTDRTHLVADTLTELHEFCKSVGIKRCWYEGYRKRHPHYDLNASNLQKVIGNNKVKIVTPQELLHYAKKAYIGRLLK